MSFSAFMALYFIEGSVTLVTSEESPYYMWYFKDELYNSWYHVNIAKHQALLLSRLY